MHIMWIYNEFKINIYKFNFPIIKIINKSTHVMG